MRRALTLAASDPCHVRLAPVRAGKCEEITMPDPTARAQLSVGSVLPGYGVSLVIIALASVVFAGIAHWTVFIPAILGGFVLLAWLLTRSGMIGSRVAAFAALLVAGIALMGTLSALPMLPDALAGASSIANPAGVFARSATAILSLAFVATTVLMILRAPASPERPDPRL
jgi:hypothetical protein